MVRCTHPTWLHHGARSALYFLTSTVSRIRTVVGMGDLGYWPPGNALCIFFGKTPASRGDEIRPASPVNVFGKVIGDPTLFKKVSSGTKVIVQKITEASSSQR